MPLLSAGPEACLAFAAAVPLAWAGDARLGEPRNALHPVAWLGHLLRPLGDSLRACSPAAAFAGGSAVWLVLALVLGAGAAMLEAALLRTHPLLAAPLLALALKPTFAWRMLRNEVTAVEAVVGGGLDAARAQLSRLVSRDTAALDAAEVREAAIETLAENLNDSVVAPLFWFAVAGLPGAVVYRFTNTADAMWGYRGGWEWAGKFAARADDVLSWLPARLTAALLRPRGHRAAWRELRNEAVRTPSPNSGWPMAAMALRLGVRLRKPGVYVLNDGGRAPQAADTALALRAAEIAARWAFGLACGAWVARAAWT